MLFLLKILERTIKVPIILLGIILFFIYMSLPYFLIDIIFGFDATGRIGVLGFIQMIVLFVFFSSETRERILKWYSKSIWKQKTNNFYRYMQKLKIRNTFGEKIFSDYQYLIEELKCFDWLDLATNRIEKGYDAKGGFIKKIGIYHDCCSYSQLTVQNKQIDSLPKIEERINLQIKKCKVKEIGDIKEIHNLTIEDSEIETLNSIETIDGEISIKSSNIKDISSLVKRGTIKIIDNPELEERIERLG